MLLRFACIYSLLHCLIEMFTIYCRTVRKESHDWSLHNGMDRFVPKSNQTEFEIYLNRVTSDNKQPILCFFFLLLYYLFLFFFVSCCCHICVCTTPSTGQIRGSLHRDENGKMPDVSSPEWIELFPNYHECKAIGFFFFDNYLFIYLFLSLLFSKKKCNIYSFGRFQIRTSGRHWILF